MDLAGRHVPELQAYARYGVDLPGYRAAVEQGLGRTGDCRSFKQVSTGMVHRFKDSINAWESAGKRFARLRLKKKCSPGNIRCLQVTCVYSLQASHVGAGDFLAACAYQRQGRGSCARYTRASQMA